MATSVRRKNGMGTRRSAAAACTWQTKELKCSPAKRYAWMQELNLQFPLKTFSQLKPTKQRLFYDFTLYGIY
jgi:hypothetical protein